jgi:hypothetical protein
MNADTNILKFAKGETDAFGLPPETPGHPSRTLLTGMRKRTLRRTLRLCSGLALAAVIVLGLGDAAVVWHDSGLPPVTEIVARPVEQAPAELQSQIEAWWTSRNAAHKPLRPHKRHLPLRVRNSAADLTGNLYGCPPSLTTVCGVR